MAATPEQYRAQFESLRPGVLRVKDLLAFTQNATRAVAEFVHAFSDRVNTLTDMALDALAAAIDMLACIDIVKDAKAALRNDFAYYKRCARAGPG